MWVICTVTLLIPILITTHEPPSKDYEMGYEKGSSKDYKKGL